MRMRFFVASALLLASATVACAADPVGRYRVEGANPGGGDPCAGS